MCVCVCVKKNSLVFGMFLLMQRPKIALQLPVATEKAVGVSPPISPRDNIEMKVESILYTLINIQLNDYMQINSIICI